MPDPLAYEHRFFAAFLQGAPTPRSSRIDRLFLFYRRDGDDLHGLYPKPRHVARRFPPAGRRKAMVIWVHPKDRLIGWRLEQAAEGTGLKLELVDALSPPADAAEGRRWMAWRQSTYDVQLRLSSAGYRMPAGLRASIRTGATVVRRALERYPHVLERHPTRYQRGTRRGGAALQDEVWVTPEGVDLAAAADALAEGQGLTWPEAFDLVAAQGAPSPGTGRAS